MHRSLSGLSPRLTASVPAALGLAVLLASPAPLFGQTGQQAASIRKACAAGVFSPEECKQKLATLSAGGQQPKAPSQAAAAADGDVQHWSEPHGRYTIAIAPGWSVDDSQGNLKVTKGASWAIFDTESRQGSAMDVAQRNAQQMKGMLGNWQVLGQSPFQTPRHHDSAGVTVRANVPMRGGNEDRVLTFAAQSAGGGNFVSLAASSLQPEAQADQGRVMAMFNSVRFAGEQ